MAVDNEASPTPPTIPSVFSQQQAQAVEEIEADLKGRLRANKIRLLPNGRQLVVGYNTQSIPDQIPDHNDPLGVEWTEMGGRSWIAGPKALRVPVLSMGNRKVVKSAASEEYELKLFRPIVDGDLNSIDYTSDQVLMSDLECIWRSAMEEELEMSATRKDLSKLCCVLVLPDRFTGTYMKLMVDVALRGLGFKSVAVIQESVGATFGAGVSMSCVVDIGAQKTSISCVEDGLVINNTRITVPFGGDDITKFFMSILLNSAFPYKSFNMSKNVYDELLANELKEKFVYVDETLLGMNIYDFFVRGPGKRTEKHKMKLYEEGLLAPMVSFNSYFIFSSKCR